LPDDEQPAGAPGQPAQQEPADERTLRAGLDVAREALAAARAAARARGQNPSRDGSGGAGSRTRRGDARRRSGAHPDDRDPQPLGRTLDRLVADRGWEVDLAVGGVIGRWAQIVGAEVAAHCTPESFEDGTLVVVTDSTAWATQVRLLRADLLRRIAEDLGAGVVRRLEVRGPSAPSWQRGRLSVRGRGPRDTYG
jgi:predicted nucleic acid-binding Zn ribbon protein